MSRENMRDCSGCPLVDRRAFLGEAAGVAAAVLVALGAAPAVARALPLRTVSAVGGGVHADEKAYPIPASDGVQVDRGEGAIVARFDGRVYVFSLACPHQNTALRWQERNNRFECPRHRSRYQPDGTFIEGRATRGMDRFAVRRDGANVIAQFDRLYQNDDEPDQWMAAYVEV